MPDFGRCLAGSRLSAAVALRHGGIQIAGKLVRASIDVVSRDGKTLTGTTAGIEANGRQFNIINVYDKQ